MLEISKKHLKRLGELRMQFASVLVVVVAVVAVVVVVVVVVLVVLVVVVVSERWPNHGITLGTTEDFAEGPNDWDVSPARLAGHLVWSHTTSMRFLIGRYYSSHRWIFVKTNLKIMLQQRVQIQCDAIGIIL